MMQEIGCREDRSELYVKFDFLIKSLFLLFSFSYILGFVLTLCAEIELPPVIKFSEVFHPGYFNSNLCLSNFGSVKNQ